MLKNYINKLRNNRQTKAANILDFPDSLFLSEESVGHEQYFNNVIVHRCVSLIASSASHVPWMVYKNQGSRTSLAPNHFVMRLLKKPNPETSGADFFTELISNLLLYGNSYLLLSGPNNSVPSGMHLLHSQSVEILTSNNRSVSYKYRFNGAERVYPIDPVSRISRVLHFKNYHPSNHLYGLSPLEAAAKSINLYSKTLDWNKALLKNAARPSGALVFQDGNGYLTDEQFERLQQQFYDNFSGSSNSGKPLVLEGGLKWQETNNAEKFEKFIELKDSSARDIAIAFNVPPQLLGINGDNTYSNMQEARLALWEENIIPLLDKLGDGLSNWFSHWFAEELLVEFDRDSISALTERRENLWAKVAGASFMTLNEKRAFVGLGAIAGGDKIVEQKEG
jgi:HK97 family phage portal protein